MKYISITIIITTILFSCTKDRLYNPKKSDNETQQEQNAIGFNNIVINEFVAKGSVNTNEFGTNEDWIELYNNTQNTIQINDNELYITDNYVSSPLQYAIPAITIPPNSYVLVWADSKDTVANQIHSNFKLSASGESLGLFLVKGGNTITLDTITYPLQTIGGISNARIPDGSNNWGVLNTPTPNASNN